MTRPRVLLVDNDPLFTRRARNVFADTIDLQIAASRAAALGLTEGWRPDVVVLNLLIDDSHSLRLLDELRCRGRHSNPRVIYLTCGVGATTRVYSDDDGFLGAVARDTGVDTLHDTVRHALDTIEPQAADIA